MSHECPECGALCFCGGDIDDCMFNFDKDVNACTHYQECQKEDGDDDFYDDDFYNDETMASDCLWSPGDM